MTRRSVRICLWFFLAVVVLAVQAAAQPPELGAIHQFHEGHEGEDPGASDPLEFRPLSDTPCQGGFADVYPCQNVDLESFIPLADLGAALPRERAAGLWGWTDPQTRREYALIALRNRVTFVDITNPKQPQVLGWLLGVAMDQPNREVNVYGNHAYIVADGSGADNGIQVFDLTQLRGRSGPPVSFPVTSRLASAGKVHTFTVNSETGFGYGQGGTCGGLRTIDLRDPANPRDLGCWRHNVHSYIHDSQCVIYRGPDDRFRGREICFASAAGALLVLDVTDKSAPPRPLGETSYPGNSFAHQAWLTEDHRYLLLNDEGDEIVERENTRTHLFDVSDLTAPDPFAFHEHATQATDHNLYVHNGKVYEANYRAGLRILDHSRIAQGVLDEIAFFDIVPQSEESGFDGAWNVYPFFGSGSIIVSGIGQGLYVLRERQERLPATCKPGPDTLCALGNRLIIEADWRDPQTGAVGKGRVAKRGGNFGSFSFFDDQGGIDAMVKVVPSGRQVKILWGQLTSVPFTIRIIDTKQKTMTRLSSGSTPCGGVQTLKGASLTGGETSDHAALYFAGEDLVFTGGPHETGSCKPGPNRLCLLNRRIAVELSWRDRGASGQGKASKVSDLAGTFGLRTPAGSDVAVKALETGTRIRILWGSLTSAAYTLRVTDTASGQVKVYSNPAGTFCGGVDPEAFEH
ncbi:MAG TPA: choice-of-anchor B family protein [Thermoanaerobaculia bacterium]|nr:choice-of-anchor B family protein [Thermoanaerobaculia bacterium]